MTQKIRVLQVTGAMNRGGAEVMIMDVARHKGPDVQFNFIVNHNGSLPQEGDFDAELQSLQCGIHPIRAQWELGPLRYANRFREIVRSLGGADVAHIHMNTKSGIIAWAAKRAGIKKIIVHSHADLRIRGHWFKVLLSKIEFRFQRLLMARYATDFWGCSKEANASMFPKHVLTPEHSTIINNAVDVAAFQSVDLNDVAVLRRELGIPENDRILGNVGRIVRHKNVVFAIEVLHALHRLGITAHFVYAGRDDDQQYLQEIISRVNELGLDPYVHYLGLRDDIPQVMNLFDVFVGPALQEGFGLVAVEAQAAGVPCVLYTGFPQLVDMKLNLVNYLSEFEAEKWAKSIVSSNKDTDLDSIALRIKQLGFDAKANTETIVNLYKEL